MDEIVAMFTGRWYVLAFLASFLVIAWAERGWQRALLWLASGALLGWLMEFSSTRTAFPFGAYDYHDEAFADEFSIGGVPLFASLSFAFLTYFGYSLACAFLSRLDRHGLDIQRVPDVKIETSLAVLLLAAVLTTLADTIIDPVAHLGRYWLLGDLYSYDGQGIHFDVPLSNYAGWLFTSALVVFANQQFDLLLRARGRSPDGFYLPSKPLWALGTYLGDCVFMLAVTIYLWTSADLPSSVPINELFLSGLALTAVFIAVASAMIWRGLHRGQEPAGQPAMAPAHP
jgi:putative membrane protein